MRSLAELRDLRGALSTTSSWPLLMTLHREAEDVGGQPFHKTIFELGFGSDLPYARIRGLLDELSEVGGLSYETVKRDVRTVEVTIL